MSANGSQQLHGTNVAPDIDTGLEARTKDALWFLARQWQMGEFEAENGGLPMQVHVTARVYPLRQVYLGNGDAPIDLHAPLEQQVEDEVGQTTPAGWNSAALDYDFGLGTDRHRLKARGYDGRALDWHDFTLTQRGEAEGEDGDLSMIPGQLQIPGLPDPRFWQVEDRDAYFDTGEAAEPNILSVLLPEFFYADIKNWYMIPAPMPSGAVREVEQVVVVDSFGIATELGPAGARGEGDDWSVFALDRDSAAPTDASTLLCLNTAAKVGENDLIEEVRFLRDEAANLVWGWERQLTDPETGLFATVLETREEQETISPSTDALRFRLKSETARSFIPYLPRQTAKQPAVDGDIALRRARSGEEWSNANPQYRGQIVAESVFLNEEDIPRSGVRIRRMHRFARGSDDQVRFWVGRDKDVAGATRKPRLSFDDLLPTGGEGG